MNIVRLFIFAILLTATQSMLSQVRQFGMEKWRITSIAAEQGDVGGAWSGILANQVFAATSTDGLFQANVSRSPAQWTPIGPFRGATIDIPAIGVQHWGAGPRDGLHVFASERHSTGNAGLPAIWRATVDMFDGVPPAWERADSGIANVDTSAVVYALAAYYFTGHTPPQPVLAGAGRGGWQGSAGAGFWTPSVFNDPLDVKVNAIDVMPKWYGDNAWAAGRSGVMPAAFRSNDKGLNWKSFRLPALIEGEASAVAIAPGSSDTVYVALNNSIQRSMDGGATWVQCVSIPNNRFTALACDPENPSHVYAGAAPDFVLMRSTDYGGSWSSISPVGGSPAGITCMTVAIMDSLPMGRLPREGLFIGTAGTGVWVFDMLFGIVAADAPSRRPTSAVLRVWPNPARETVTVEFGSNASGGIAIVVSDMLGRVVRSHAASRDEAGIRHVEMRLDGLPPGAYRLVADAASGRSARTLLIIR